MSDTPRTDDKSFDVYAEYAGRKKLMEKDLVDGEFSRQLERELNAAKEIIADLLEHPYPHDLMVIRKDAAGYTSEEYAAEEMEAYCTEESALKARAEWKLAQETAREFLKKQ